MTTTTAPHTLPSVGTVASLLAGRLVYRLGMYGAGLALLALWGPEQFAVYATATGAAGWLFALTASGPEKAALVLLPRAGGAGLERRFIGFAVTPAVVLTCVVAVTWGTVSPSWSRFLLAAALSTAVGGTAVLVALHRIRREPWADVVAYLTVAAGYAVAVVFAATTDAGVDEVLRVLLAVALGVVLVLVLRLWPRTTADPAPPELRRESWRAAGVLGVGELLGMAAFSVLFADFAVADDARQTSLFYVLVVVSSCFSVGLLYVLRLLQPHVVSRSEAHGEAATWRVARRILVGLLVLGAPAAAACAVMATRLDHAVVPWAALALELALFATVAVAVLLLESSGGRGRGWSAVSAVVEFLVVAAAGWWLVHHAGAAGAFTALALGVLARTAVLLRASTTPRTATSEKH